MAAHIQTMETQDAMLLKCLGAKIAPCTHEDHLHKLSDCAMLLDNCCSKIQAQQHNTNDTNVSNGNGNKSGQQGSCGGGSQGHGCGNGSHGCGHGNGGHGSGGCGIFKDVVGPPATLTPNVRTVCCGHCFFVSCGCRKKTVKN